jgi:hypothetical protein
MVFSVITWKDQWQRGCLLSMMPIYMFFHPQFPPLLNQRVYSGTWVSLSSSLQLTTLLRMLLFGVLWSGPHMRKLWTIFF